MVGRFGLRAKWVEALPSALPYLRDHRRQADTDRGGKANRVLKPGEPTGPVPQATVSFIGLLGRPAFTPDAPARKARLDYRLDPEPGSACLLVRFPWRSETPLRRCALPR
jgi:hypothetical protein